MKHLILLLFFITFCYTQNGTWTIAPGEWKYYLISRPSIEREIRQLTYTAVASDQRVFDALFMSEMDFKEFRILYPEGLEYTYNTHLSKLGVSICEIQDALLYEDTYIVLLNRESPSPISVKYAIFAPNVDKPKCK